VQRPPLSSVVSIRKIDRRCEDPIDNQIERNGKPL
jgi:hypothetical protein